jgi:hypothetical protein
MFHSLHSLRARKQIRKRRNLRQLDHRPSLEGLEDRTVPSITFSGPGNSGMATLTGTDNADQFVIQLKPQDPTTIEFSDDGGTRFVDAALSGITAVQVNGLDGADRLRLNEDNGLIATATGLPITFDGGRGFDVLSVRGDPRVAVTETLTAGDTPFDSTLTMTDGTNTADIKLQHVNHIFDISKADSLTVNANDQNNFIQIGFGLVPVDLVTTNTIRGVDFNVLDDNAGQPPSAGMAGDIPDNLGGSGDSSDGEDNPLEVHISRAFTPITYANKTHVTVNALGGDDLFLVNVFHAATGEQSLTLDGGSGINVAAIRNFPPAVTLTLVNINHTFHDATSIFIHELYEERLGRPAEDGVVTAWVQLLATQGPLAVVSAIENSTEAKLDLVRQLYVHYLGRMPGNAEAMPWVIALQSGMTEEQAISAFLSSGEFAARAQQMFNTSGGNQSFVQALYQVVLDRSAGDLEVAAWSAAAALLGRSSVSDFFVAAPEFRLDAITSLYATILHRPPDLTGLNAWVGSTLSLEDIRMAILSSAEAMANG